MVDGLFHASTPPPPSRQDVNLASESVAGEEDPGASLDMAMGCVRAAGPGPSDQPVSESPARLNPGDEVGHLAFFFQRLPLQPERNVMNNPLANALAPCATHMIRLDHTHVLATYHQFKASRRLQAKQGLVNTTCLALEIHAQLEEEIFYPAVRAVSDNPVLQKSVPEHDEMRRLISLLRGMSPQDVRYDNTYHELMRSVIHHVADEETVVLPEAERLLAGQLGELGKKMMKRRLQLMAPRTGDLAMSMVRAMPGSSMAMLAGAVVAVVAGVLVGRRWARD